SSCRPSRAGSSRRRSWVTGPACTRWSSSWRSFSGVPPLRACSACCWPFRSRRSSSPCGGWRSANTFTFPPEPALRVMAWEVHHRKGVWLPQIGWWLDAQTRAARSFVSHAHGDQIDRHREVLCTAATARLLHARLPGRREETVLPFGRPHALDFGTTATLHPAGHIFGSSQILLENPAHGSLLYTGDFKLRPGLAAEACATPPADVLIMETTFGLPRYIFPPEAEVIAGIIEFCQRALSDGATPVLLCYSLGKSQEVLRALAPAKLPVMLHADTFRLTRVCEQLGLVLPPYREFSTDEAGGHVVLCPPHGQGLLSRLPARRTPAAPGPARAPPPPPPPHRRHHRLGGRRGDDLPLPLRRRVPPVGSCRVRRSHHLRRARAAETDPDAPRFCPRIRPNAPIAWLGRPCHWPRQP